MKTNDRSAQSPGSSHDKRASFGFRQVRMEAKQGLVNNVFSKVADRYDLMNDAMSAGLHRLWKDDLINWLAPSKRGEPRLLDVAGGTGDVTLRYLRAAGAGARAVICDISGEMLRAGRQKIERSGFADRISLVQGNAECLPLGTGTIDAYTIAFGIRNVPDIDAALAEAYRVLRPGGRFLCLEFSEVAVPILDKAYDAYSFQVIPRLGQLIAGEAEPYRYLVESIRKFPDQEDFAEMIGKAGFAQVKYRNLSGGIAAIHSGWRI